MNCHFSHKPGSCEFGQSKTIYQGLISPRWGDRIEFLPLQSGGSDREPRWPWWCLLTWHSFPAPSAARGRERDFARGCLMLYPCAKPTANHEVLLLQLNSYLQFTLRFPRIHQGPSLHRAHPHLDPLLSRCKPRQAVQGNWGNGAGGGGGVSSGRSWPGGGWFSS